MVGQCSRHSCKERSIHIQGNLTAGNDIIEGVTAYKYIGCCLNRNWDKTQESRFAGQTGIQKIKKALTNTTMLYLLTILLHGSGL